MKPPMTNAEFRAFLDLIIQVLKDSKTIDEAVKKIEALK